MLLTYLSPHIVQSDFNKTEFIQAIIYLQLATLYDNLIQFYINRKKKLLAHLQATSFLHKTKKSIFWMALE